MSNPACSQCGKTVYFAEKQSYDGKDFHGICLQTYKKNMKTGLSGHQVGFSSYPAGNTGSVPVNKSPPVGGGNSFCSNCGAKATGGKFCSGCGTSF